MAAYTITTTDDQETALSFAFEHPYPNPEEVPGLPPHPPTQDAYFQQQIDLHVLAVMGRRYVVEANAALLASLSTVPEEQRDDVVMQIEHIIGLNGGYVVEKGTRSAKPPMAPFLPMPVARRD